ncbi:hypothetical protein [Nocardia sp. NPDC051750]|uniref:hypothetical protein n=1 Tax=Nocardia sp. NPDC051750 TaxID=3364325 RepID=UPI0037AC1191
MEIDQVTLGSDKEPSEFRARQFDHGAVALLDIDGQPDQVAMAFGRRGRIVTEIWLASRLW